MFRQKVVSSRHESKSINQNVAPMYSFGAYGTDPNGLFG